ncbi:MAG: polysaccharide biosynthesis/export family protein [Phycisphaerales bacterium]|nr:polysaccharide biosynthesis/export family protein [Phycisphaerales bacterium]
MSGTLGNCRVRCGGAIRFSALAIGAVVAAFTASACHKDHRVTLDQFLAMQQGCKEAEAEKIQAMPPPEVDQHLGPYRAGPNDILRVTLTSAQANTLPPTQVRVDRNGTIDLPVIGAISVGGKELEDVEDAISAAYVPRVYGEAVVLVELVMPETTNVLVVGAVTVPGFVPLRRTERNMLYAIVGAGGVSAEASGKATLRRVRHPAETATFDLTDPVQVNEALALSPLEAGDIIAVDAATPNTVFVGGLVNRAAPQMYPQGAQITALQAVAGAYGLRTDVTPTEGTLIRRMPDGRDVHVKLDWGRMTRGEDSNITLAAGDILWVPETLGTKVQDFINKNIFLRAGVSVTYNVSGIEFLNRRSLQSRSGGGGNQQDNFDPLGFLGRNALLQNINSRPTP